MWYIYTIEYCLAMRRNELSVHAPSGINFKINMKRKKAETIPGIIWFHLQMAPHMWWLNLSFLLYCHAKAIYIQQKPINLIFEFWSFPRLVLCVWYRRLMLDSRREPQIPVSHVVISNTLQSIMLISYDILQLDILNALRIYSIFNSLELRVWAEMRIRYEYTWMNSQDENALKLD